jgi:hypothetical protein
MKSNQFSLKIASNKVQEAYETPDDLELNMSNSDFLDNFQVFASWLCTKYAGKEVVITVQVKKP